MSDEKRSTVLIVGGAGYIGSHMVDALVRNGEHVLVLDDLSTGHRDALPDSVILYEGDLADKAILDQILTQYTVKTVMHFAALIQVGESVTHPSQYYHHNVMKTLVLLDKLIEHGVPYFIFSSSAAVYGNPLSSLIDETHPMEPINPYGTTKLMVDRILADYATAYGLQSASLRYFNASGAHEQGHLAQRPSVVTHLIPSLLKVVTGERDAFVLHGDDYETVDGSCVRDFIHVMDLCSAHLSALKYLQDQHPGHVVLNVGTGQGCSVKELMRITQEVTQQSIPFSVGPRREGDPAILVADARKITELCGWVPRYNDIRLIIEHAWQAEQQVVKNKR